MLDVAVAGHDLTARGFCRIRLTGMRLTGTGMKSATQSLWLAPVLARPLCRANPLCNQGDVAVISAPPFPSGFSRIHGSASQPFPSRPASSNSTIPAPTPATHTRAARPLTCVRKVSYSASYSTAFPPTQPDCSRRVNEPFLQPHLAVVLGDLDGPYAAVRWLQST